MRVRWDCLRVGVLVYDQHMATVQARYISFDDGDIEHLIRERSTIEMLADELRRRGCIVIYPGELARIAIGDTPPAVDEADMDFDKWMTIAIELDRIDAYGINAQASITTSIVKRLVDLLQPPSVREARKKSAQAE